MGPGRRDLGDHVLEIGRGPGLTRDVLRRHVPTLTVVEVDAALAGALAERLEGTNVTVVCDDASKSGLPSERYSAATCFTMLHHMATPADQDRLFAKCTGPLPGRFLRRHRRRRHAGAASPARGR